jgi:hypothetical protein
LLISNTAAAQDIISISGTVTTRADGLSVPGAVVTIAGVDVKAITDANRRYSLQVPRNRVRDEREWNETVIFEVMHPWTRTGLPDGLRVFAVLRDERCISR